MKKMTISKLLGTILLATGLASISLVSIQAQAFDLGKELENAAKKEIEKVKMVAKKQAQYQRQPNRLLKTSQLKQLSQRLRQQPILVRLLALPFLLQQLKQQK